MGVSGLGSLAMNPMATNAGYAGAEANPGNTISAQYGPPIGLYQDEAGVPFRRNDQGYPLDADGYPLSDTLPPNPPGEGSTLGRLAPLLAGGAAIAALSGMGSGSSAPANVQRAVGSLPASQQAYLNRPGVMWDWDKLTKDAASSNLTLDQFMARNWNRVTSGEYNVARPAMAQGGLNAMARFVRGGGTGRSDEIDAKLSDGEYVIDAETVAMLGDGSSKAGAKRLDEMRASIRKHKGKTLARGKFSPDAKSPLTYLKGVA